jgi:hypothetical protein
MGRDESAPHTPEDAARRAVERAFASHTPRPLLDAAELLLEALSKHPEWESLLSAASAEELGAIAAAFPDGFAARLQGTDPAS